MDEVVLDGVTYVRAAVAAKRFKYTTDYIGQLCRAEKVDAQLVGRSWFVNPDSLEQYKHAKRAPQTQVDDAVEKTVVPVTTAPKRQIRAVEPVLATKTARQMNVDGNDLTRKVSVAYSIDDGHLIPELNVHTKPATAVRVEPAESTDVSVKGDKKHTTFKPMDLPDVALSGVIEIGELIDEQVDEEQKYNKNIPDITKQNKAISESTTDEREGRQVTVTTKKPAIKINRTSRVGDSKIGKLTVSPKMSQTVSQKKITIAKPVKKTSMQKVERSNIALQAFNTTSASKKAGSRASIHNLANKPLKITATKPTKSSVSHGQHSGLSLVRFALLLCVVVMCGLAVGYLLVVSPTEYTVTASVVSS